jgi:hypothetical protein
MPRRRIVQVVLQLALCYGCMATFAQVVEPNLSQEQMEKFLLTAEVVKSTQLGKGTTHPWRLTLSDGKVVHDAAFQPVDIREDMMRMRGGSTEMHFVDSYHYNIAAYELAKLIGLDDMIPVSVERKWNGQRGALVWWVPSKWDEGTRQKLQIRPPDLDAWNQQMYRVRLFSQLIYDTDRNLGNVLITEDWKIWMIDFTRAFRLYPKLANPNDLERCDRRVLEKLRTLDANTVYERIKPHLTKWEVKALIARRDRILERFQGLMAEKGEAAVLY